MKKICSNLLNNFCSLIDSEQQLYGPDMNILPPSIEIRKHILSIVETISSFKTVETLFASTNLDKLECIFYLYHVFKESLNKILAQPDQKLKGLFKFFFYKLPSGKKIKEVFIELPSYSTEFAYFMVVMEHLLDFSDNKLDIKCISLFSSVYI